ARHGEGATATARRHVGAAAAGLRSRLSVGGAVLPARLPPLGLAAAVLHRRPAGAARPVRARPRARVGRVARDPARELVTPGTGDRVELEALPLSDGPDGADEHGLARHAGYVSHLSPAGLGLGTHGARRADGVLPSGRARGWRAVRSLFRPAGPPAHHWPGAGGSPASDPDVGIRTRNAAAR